MRRLGSDALLRSFQVDLDGMLVCMVVFEADLIRSMNGSGTLLWQEHEFMAGTYFGARIALLLSYGDHITLAERCGLHFSRRCP